MRFNISQCRPAKKTAAPRGLRRSTRNSSSCPEQQQQQQQPEIAFALDNTQPFRQTSFEPEESTADSELVKQSPKLEGFDEAGIDRHRSFRLEALVKPKVLSRTSSCTTIGRKRVVGVDELSQELAFPDCSSPVSSSRFYERDCPPRKRVASPRTPSSCLDRSLSASLTISDLGGSPRVSFPLSQTPSTPTSRLTFGPGSADDADGGGDSLLEELPFDLLLLIVCCLEHDDLRPVSHVCKRLMKAVSIARLCHFSFTTPHREKKGKRSQLFLCNEEECISKGGLAGTFVRPPTPNAPRQLSRPAKAKFSDFETCPFASPLFQQEPPLQSRKPLRLLGVSNRILFNEDELCQAVVQNTL